MCSYFHTLIHCSCLLWITVVVPESELGLNYSRRYTLQERQTHQKNVRTDHLGGLKDLVWS